MTLSSHTVPDVGNPAELEGALNRRPGPLGWLLVGGLCALLIFGVLSFGAVDEWSTFGLEAGSGALFLLWVAKQYSAGRIRISNNPLYIPALLFFGLVLAQLVFRRSAYGYVTKYEALHYVCYGILLFTAAECVRQESARKFFVLTMSLFGAAYALFAVVQNLSSNGKIFWFHSPRFASGMIFGSYVNHNHFAGFMEMITPIPLVLSLGHLLRGGKRVVMGFCGALMATTIFLCASRGGMIAFTFEAVLFAALALGKKRSPRLALGALLFCGIILGLIVFLDKGHSLLRLGELAPGVRWDITKDSLRMFSHRPVLGWGLGTFPTVYPKYRSFYTNLFVNEAHNDYAQALVETGALGFGLLLWFVWRLLQTGLIVSRRWEFQWDWALSFAAVLGCTGILVHSFVDFNLQIPANAAFFYVLCALSASKPFERLSHGKRSRSTREAAQDSQLAKGRQLDWTV